MKLVCIKNLSNQLADHLQLKVCEGFFSRLKGLMFSRNIELNSGLLFINKSEDRLNSTIHMLFMNYDLTIIWVDTTGIIVDKILAKRWKTIAGPHVPAKFIIEAHTERFNEYNTGDVLDFHYG